MLYWKIKELSTLTGLSVRTLHHYDAIGLLKPSKRLQNSYRVYTIQDLYALQKIRALKFFGFSLKQIQKFSERTTSQRELFCAQKKLLEDQLSALERMVTTLGSVINDLDANHHVPWERIITLIKGYDMVDTINNHWISKILSPEEFEQFVHLCAQFSQKENERYGQEWKELREEITQNITSDPASPIGKQLALAWKALVDKRYAQYPQLKDAFKKAYKNGTLFGHTDAPTKEVMDWIAKAFAAHKIW